MRYYVGQCEYKWSHVGKTTEQAWIIRETGVELYKEVELRNWTWVLIRSNSQTLDPQRYCRCDIYVDTDDSKHATLFQLRFSKAVPVPLAK